MKTQKSGVKTFYCSHCDKKFGLLFCDRIYYFTFVCGRGGWGGWGGRGGWAGLEKKLRVTPKKEKKKKKQLMYN